MAAAARPPGIVDARIPCPLCGGLVHPVAGRCKHCKEDLTSFRAGRPQAAAELPSLNGIAHGPHGHGSNGTNGQTPAPVAVPVPVATREATQPILPPRPTGRSMQAERPRSALWRSWPMVVIALAVIAIVIAAAVMVWPQGSSSSGRKLMQPPAPERMDTNPVPPKASQIDPWGQPSPSDPNPAVPDPRDPLGQAAPPDDPDDPDDLLGQLPLRGGTAGSAFMISMFDKACTKLKACPGVDQSMMSMACDQFQSLPKPPPPRNCPSAQRCLDAIDKLSCDQVSADISPLSVVTLVGDCTTAMRDC